MSALTHCSSLQRPSVSLVAMLKRHCCETAGCFGPGCPLRNRPIFPVPLRRSITKCPARSTLMSPRAQPVPFNPDSFIGPVVDSPWVNPKFFDDVKPPTEHCPSHSPPRLPKTPNSPVDVPYIALPADDSEEWFMEALQETPKLTYA